MSTLTDIGSLITQTPGIIVCPQQRYRVGGQLRRLLTLMARLPGEQMQNRLEFLSDWDE